MGDRYLIVGSGFSGCVLANRLVNQSECTVEIWEERGHAGGNCHTSRDAETGVMVHHYGPHIFNTDKKHIWDFVNDFGELRPYVHRVKAMSRGKVYPLPVNLLTINQFFNKAFSPAEARQFLDTIADSSITDPKNFEEQAHRFIGKELYEAFFYGYTKKQWGCEPSLLPASILRRIPVRFNYDDNYHPHLYTGIPVDGYSAIMERMINDKRITLRLNTKFEPAAPPANFTHIFYTGPIDAFFQYKHGRLGYRTVKFEKFVSTGDHQGVAQMNYCDVEVPYTRIAEHKHFTPWEEHAQTVYFKEYSSETGVKDEPFYPKRLEDDKRILTSYREEAHHLKNISFLGRLATYRYMDMHNVIDEAIDFASLFLKSSREGAPLPVFPNVETITS